MTAPKRMYNWKHIPPEDFDAGITLHKAAIVGERLLTVEAYAIELAYRDEVISRLSAYIDDARIWVDAQTKHAIIDLLDPYAR